MGAFDVTLKVTNIAGQNTMVKHEYIEVGTSAISINSGPGTIRIFPNPTTGRFTLLSGQENSATVTIFDQVGKIVCQNEITQQKTVMTLSNLLPGFYFLRLTDNETGKISISKLIIQ